MLVGVVSDTHSRHVTAARAVAGLRDRGVAAVLHCGDIEDPQTIALFRGLVAHFVYGNCDRDRDALRGAVAEVGGTLHEPFGHLELAGRSLAFLHGDDKRLLHDLEHSDAFNYLFYGHTHEAEEHTTGRTRVINPGALHRARPKTYLVLDLATGETESVTVE